MLRLACWQSLYSAHNTVDWEILPKPVVHAIAVLAKRITTKWCMEYSTNANPPNDVDLKVNIQLCKVPVHIDSRLPTCE